MTTYTAINLTKYHERGPIGPDYFQAVKLDKPNAKAGELIVKQRYMSLDPAMFGWMNADFGGATSVAQFGIRLG